MELLVKIQLFLEQLGQTILALIKVLLLSKFSKGKKFEIAGKEVVIIGNGPSLQKDIIKYRKFLSGKDLVCVNHFPITDLYTELKPRFYITGAPEYWLENIEPDQIQSNTKMFNAMNEKTTWPLQFFIPFDAKKYKRWQGLVKSRKNITFHYYNNIGIEGFRKVIHFLFKNWLGMPRPHNVLITSIYICINIGYKKIYLLGADHSWLKELDVTEENIALLNQKHFYDENTAKPNVMRKSGRGQRKLHEILHKFMLTFKGYFILRDYAEKRQAQIFNGTKGSYIDAFERIDLNKYIETENNVI